MLYAIGDLHLSLDADKPMDVFGGGWQNYVERIKAGFSNLTPDDTTVLCGDISWGMDFKSSLSDFKFIDNLPGKKIILKGNHDYWWNSLTKIKAFFAEYGISTIDILHNNCYFYEDVAICGTRGWFFQEEKGDEHDKKIMNRELMRLETSLKLAGEKEKLCFLHYPPRYGSYICNEMIEILQKYSVKHCYYGHIHGFGHKNAVVTEVDGISYHMVSADYIGFTPEKVKFSVNKPEK